jgi:hypothetical protein
MHKKRLKHATVLAPTSDKLTDTPTNLWGCAKSRASAFPSAWGWLMVQGPISSKLKSTAMTMVRLKFGVAEDCSYLSHTAALAALGRDLGFFYLSIAIMMSMAPGNCFSGIAVIGCVL